MKKIIVPIIFLLVSIQIVFAVSTVDEQSKLITAYKSKTSGDVPVPELSLRLLDPSELEYDDGKDINLPMYARGNSYTSFHWVLGGNVYGAVSVQLSFGPMALGGLPRSQTSITGDTKYIPYAVKLSNTSSRIGNTILSTKKRTAAEGEPIKFKYMGLTFDFYYAEWYDSETKTVTVDKDTKSCTLSFNMKTNTFVVNYPSSAKVCSYWNRYGKGDVTLNIPADAKNYSDGLYRANVTVTFTSEE